MVASIKSAGKLSESSIRSQDDLEKVVEQEQPKKKWRWRVDTSDAPKEIFNRTLYLSILVFGVLGSARGYDEGNISGTLAQVSFKKTFGLSDPHKSKDEVANLKSNIAAMVQLGSIVVLFLPCTPLTDLVVFVPFNKFVLSGLLLLSFKSPPRMWVNCTLEDLSKDLQSVKQLLLDHFIPLKWLLHKLEVCVVVFLPELCTLVL